MKITFPLKAEANSNLYGAPDQRAGRATQLLPSDEELAEIQKRREEEEKAKEAAKKMVKKPEGGDDEEEPTDDDSGDDGDDDDTESDEESDDEGGEDEDGEETEDGDEESEEEEVDEDEEAEASTLPTRRIPRGEEAEAADETMKVVSGFPGIGKSHFYNQDPDHIADSDSSKFDKTMFPKNYIEHIKGKLEDSNTNRVLVSSHDAVRNALVQENIPFYLVYPDASLKDEYMERYRERGSPQPFLDLMDKNWDNFIAECEKQTGCEKIVLQAGEYLSDVLSA